jgi:dihydroorotate dehydrogenase (fumarate)
MPDLRSDYLGLELASPLVASSSPLTRDLDGQRALEDAGAAALVLPSLFEEQLAFEAGEVDRMLETGSETFGEALSFFPDLEDYNTGPDAYLETIRRAKRALGIPVIASLNGHTSGGWVEHAAGLEQAGADALELNLYRVAADPEVTGAEVERSYRELVSAVRGAVRIPLAVKIGPFFSSLAYTARELVAAGADGLVLFNRFYQPDLDLESLDVLPRLRLSTSEELRLPLRWIALLHGQVDASLAATTGIHTAEDVLKVLLAGADVAMLASALLENGPDHLKTLRRGVEAWMEEHEYASVRQLRGSVSRRSAADPTAYERANYMQTLQSYSSAYRRRA